MTLEAFDNHKIDRAQLCQQFHERRLGFAAQLVNERPTAARGNDDLTRSGFAMQPRILARPVDVEFVMRMLDRRDFEATPDQDRDDLGDQRRLAGSTPAGETDNAHRHRVSPAPVRGLFAAAT